ncbi:hypothetical protein BG004_005460 [Podila humilis]|nr:hypothetical protein BG004_005460 [Podila humilis]
MSATAADSFFIPEGCELQHRAPNLGLSLAVLAGIFISYLPQHYRIIRNKNSDGISPWFLLIGCLSATSSLLNIVILQQGVIQCCRYITAGQCFRNMLGIVQLGVQSLMFGLVFVLYVIYYPPYKKASNAVHKLNMNIILPSQSFEWTISVLFAKIVGGHFVLCGMITAILLYCGESPKENGGISNSTGNNGWILTWAGFLGTSGILLAMIQFLPQIVWTFVRKSVGALSTLMLLIQTPCTIMLAVSLSQQRGANWSTWMVYAVSGTLQGILLTVCVAFWFISRQRGATAASPLGAGSGGLLSSFSDTTTSLDLDDTLTNTLDAVLTESTPLLPTAIIRQSS